jgi:SAM-dependent methyltransferase
MNFPQLMSLATGHVEARIVQTAVDLAIFDALESSARTAEDIASHLELEVRATESLLNALAALKLLDKDADRFSIVHEVKPYLLTSSSRCIGGMIRFESSLWRCWEKLPDAIRSGKPVRSPNMYQDDPDETEIFIGAMDSLVKARGDSDVVANVLNWDEVDELLDLGSGPATYPIALCKKFPKLTVTIFDLPGTVRITARYVREAAMQERINLVAGDYRVEPIPGNYDVIFLSNIIHGEGFDENRELIHKLYANLKAGGRLIIKDHILDETGANPPVGAIFSLLMLLTTASGRCYTFAEISSWMADAGLIRVQQIELPPPLTSSLVIGIKELA